MTDEKTNPFGWWRAQFCRFMVHLVVILALAGAVLAGSTGYPIAVQAATTDAGTTTVSFNVAEAIQVTAWPATTFALSADATPGVPVVSDMLAIEVKSNSSWGVQVSSDNATGALREFDPGVGGYISNGAESGPVEWAPSAAGPWTALSSTPTTMFTGQAATGEAGASVGFVLRVTPSFDDVPLSAGREYRITLTYTAGVGY